MAIRPRKRGLAALSWRIESWLDAERDQLVLWLPVMLGLGVAAWFVGPDSAAWVGWMLACAGLATGALLLDEGRRARRALFVAGIVAALGCALVWLRAEQVAAPVLSRPTVTVLEGEVETLDMLAARDLVRLRIAVTTAGLPPRVRVNVADEDVPAGLRPGGRVRLKARLMPPPEPAVPGAYDFARVAWFQGIGATGRALGPVELLPQAHRQQWRNVLASARMALSRHIQSELPGSGGAIASALATGDQGAIPEADAEAMRRSGLAHLLSVSGLHVTAVVAATMWLALRLLALSPWLALRAPLTLIAASVAALTALAYTLLTGAEIPTVRSFLAAVIVLVGMAIGREAITLRLVAAGAFVVLLLWPEALASVSFQLSFAAVTAIVALHENRRVADLLKRREEGVRMRFFRAGLGLLLTGLVVEIALSPIALYHFHRTGLFGAFANIVAIPLTTFVIMPLEGLALLLDLLGLGPPLWWMTGKAVALLLAIAHRVAAMPGALALLPSMPGGAFALTVGGGLWLALWRSRVRIAGFAPLALGAAWALSVPPPDLLVTGDGRHMAIREGQRLVLLRDRAGDYVRDVLGENAGIEGEARTLDSLPGARCGPDLCSVSVDRGGRRWRILATRSDYLVEIAEMNRACGAADIVVSERRLPRTCRPRWIKLDRDFFRQNGGVSIDLARARITTVAEARRGKPWAERPNPLALARREQYTVSRASAAP